MTTQAPSDQKTLVKPTQGTPDKEKKETLTALAEEWKRKRSPEVTQKLIKALRPTIEKGVSAFANGDKSMHVAALSLAFRGIETYDKSKGAALSTHLWGHLKGLQRKYAERVETIRVPEAKRLERTKLNNFVRDYEAEKGHEPSTLEISEALALPMKRVTYLRSMPIELNEAAVTGEKGDIIADKMPKGEDDAWKDYVYYDLSPTDQKIYEWTTGAYGAKKLSKTEIARKLKVTPAAVTGRLAKLEQRFKEAAEKL